MYSESDRHQHLNHNQELKKIHQEITNQNPDHKTVSYKSYKTYISPWQKTNIAIFDQNSPNTQRVRKSLITPKPHPYANKLLTIKIELFIRKLAKL